MQYWPNEQLASAHTFYKFDCLTVWLFDKYMQFEMELLWTA